MSAPSNSAPRFHVVVCGPAASGKSSLIRRFVDNANCYDHAELELRDSPGDNRPVETYYLNVDALVVVVDSQSPNILEQVQEWVGSAHCKAPFFIILNKSDLQPQVADETIVALHDKYHVPVFHVSALTGDQVEQTFRSIAANLIKPDEEEKIELDSSTRNSKHKLLEELENFPRLLAKLWKLNGAKEDDDDEPISRTEAVALQKAAHATNIIPETMKSIRKACKTSDTPFLQVKMAPEDVEKFREVFEKEKGFTVTPFDKGPKSTAVWLHLSWDDEKIKEIVAHDELTEFLTQQIPKRHAVLTELYRSLDYAISNKLRSILAPTALTKEEFDWLQAQVKQWQVALRWTNYDEISIQYDSQYGVNRLEKGKGQEQILD